MLEGPRSLLHRVPPNSTSSLGRGERGRAAWKRGGQMCNPSCQDPGKQPLPRTYKDREDVKFSAPQPNHVPIHIFYGCCRLSLRSMKEVTRHLSTSLNLPHLSPDVDFESVPSNIGSEALTHRSERRSLFSFFQELELNLSGFMTFLEPSYHDAHMPNLVFVTNHHILSHF